MAIKTLEVDRRDLISYRKLMRERGFSSARYFSLNGFDVNKLKILAKQGKMDAVRFAVGSTVKWYYSERQAELAHLRGEV